MPTAQKQTQPMSATWVHGELSDMSSLCPTSWTTRTSEATILDAREALAETDLGHVACDRWSNKERVTTGSYTA